MSAIAECGTLGRLVIEQGGFNGRDEFMRQGAAQPRDHSPRGSGAGFAVSE